MAYNLYAAVTINASLCGTANSTNFPMLFDSTLIQFATVANGGNIINTYTAASGFVGPADLIFSSTTNLSGSGILPFEIVGWNAVTGALSAYVQIPTLSVTTNTVIYILYSNGAITTDQSNHTGTWSNSFLAVYHFGNYLGLTADSTGNVNLTNAGASQALILGSVGGFSADFAGSASMSNSSAGSVDITTGTMEAWINPTSVGSGNSNYFAGMDSNALGGYYIRNNGNQFDWVIQATSTGSTILRTTANVLLNGSWNSYAVTWTGSTPTMQMYIGGANASYTVITSGTQGAPPSGLTTFYLGNVNSKGAMNGYLSEIRISSVVRSSSWITASSNNQLNPPGFYGLTYIRNAQQVLFTAAQARSYIRNNQEVIFVGSQRGSRIRTEQQVLIVAVGKSRFPVTFVVT